MKDSVELLGTGALSAMSLILFAFGAGVWPWAAHSEARHPTVPRRPAPTVAATPAADHTPAIVRVYVAGEAQVVLLSSAGFDLLETRGPDYLLAVVDEPEQHRLASMGFRIEVDQEETARLRVVSGPLGPPGYACYRSVPEIEAFLTQTVTDHPALAELIDFGDSWEKVTPGGATGHDLWALRISNSSVPAPPGQDKPRFFLMANIHARELTTPEIAMRFVSLLTDSYGLDPDVAWLVDHHEFWVVITANPDGRVMAEEGLSWRKNTDNDDGCTNASTWGVDLNRNHSYRWGGIGSSDSACHATYRGPAAASEPEVQALEALMRNLFPDQRGPGQDDPAPADTTGIMISMHSYGRLVLWPWGDTSDLAPNSASLKSIGDKFAAYNGYTSCQSGPCLYPVSGATDDWAYGELGVPAFTFELGRAFFESCSALEGIWEENRPALLHAARIARAPYALANGPDALQVSFEPTAVVQGRAAHLSATIDDTLNGGQQIVQAEAYLDTPPWLGGAPAVLEAEDGVFDSPVEAVLGSFETGDTSVGRHLVYVRGMDATGDWGPVSATWLEVTNLGAEPDFTLSIEPSLAEVCIPSEATFQVEVQPILGYDAPVALAAATMPEGVETTVSPQVVLPPSQVAQVSVATRFLETGGQIMLVVTGTGQDGKVRQAQAELLAVAGIPETPQLLWPNAGATMVPVRPELRWQGLGMGNRYRVQVALDSEFAQIALDVAGLEAVTYRVQSALEPDTRYFWRVAAENRCGWGSWSSGGIFTTGAKRLWMPLVVH